jgi:hypothetical protein
MNPRRKYGPRICGLVGNLDTIGPQDRHGWMILAVMCRSPNVASAPSNMARSATSYRSARRKEARKLCVKWEEIPLWHATTKNPMFRLTPKGHPIVR